MALTIGQLTGYVDVDDSRFNSGLNNAQSEFQSFGNRLSTTAKTIGATAGAAIAVGIGTGVSQNLQMDQATAKMQAQLGTTAEKSERLGEVAGSLFADAYTNSVSEAGDAVTSVTRNIEGMSSASSSELESVTGEIVSLASTMELRVGEASRAVGQMIRTGLADSPREAMDVMQAATQQGANRLDDLGDTVNEYSTNFRALGLSGKQAMGLITQAMDGGARSSDQAADALKEFSIRVAEGGTQAEEGFDAIGMSSDEMAAKVSQGGSSAREALSMTLDRLQEMPPSADRSAAAMALFGSQGEDMAGALNEMDLSGATGALGNVEGASERADEALQNTSQKTLDGLVRSFQQAAASATELPGPLGVAAAGAQQYGGAALSTLTPIGLMIAAQRSAKAASRASAATQAASGAKVRKGWIRTGVSATVNAAKVVAGWVATGVAATASAAGAMARAVALTVAGWTRMAAVALRNAARMAVAWLLAMGPIGWIIAAVGAIVAAFIWAWQNFEGFRQFWKTLWSGIKTIFSAVWDWLVAAVKNYVQYALDVFGWFARLPGMIGGFFSDMVSAIGDWIDNAVDWVAGLPGRILSALGNLGSLLWDAGSNVIQGLIDGIQSKIGSIGDTMGNIAGKIRDFLPFSPAKEGPLSGSGNPENSGTKIAGMLADGMNTGNSDVARAGRDLASAASHVDDANPRSSRATGGVDTDTLVAALRKALGPVVRDAVDGSRLRVSGREWAELVNRANARQSSRGVHA